MLIKAFTYYLSVSLLLGNIGVEVFTHTCHLFGVSETTLFDFEECCGEMDTASESLDVKCCSVDHASYYLDFDTDLKNKIHYTFLPTPNPWAETAPPNHLKTKNQSFSEFANPPPKKFNRELLSDIQVFLL